MDKGKAKDFLVPDLRRILLFLAIPVCTAAILFSGPSLFPIGASAEIIFVIPQILLGTFLALGTVPFTIVAMIFRAFGFDPFYTAGTISKTGMILGILVTIFWWYVLSCSVISVYHKFKEKGK